MVSFTGQQWAREQSPRGVKSQNAGAASGAGGPWGNEPELGREEACVQRGSPGSPVAPGATSRSWTGEESPGSPCPARPPAAHAGCVWRAGEEASRVASPRLLPAVLRHVSPLAADRQAAGLSQANGLSVPQCAGSRPCRTSRLGVCRPAGSSSSRPPSALCFPDSPPTPGSFRPAPCTPGSPSSTPKPPPPEDVLALPEAPWVLSDCGSGLSPWSPPPHPFPSVPHAWLPGDPQEGLVSRFRADRAQPLQPCLSLCTHGSQPARLLRPQERAAISSSRGSSRPRDRNCVSYVSCLDRWVL